MSDAPKDGGMLGAGGGWGGGGRGPLDGMVGVVDLVEIVGDVVKQGGAAVVPLRCVGGRGKVICRGRGASLLSAGNQICCYWEFVGWELFVVGILFFFSVGMGIYVALFLNCFGADRQPTQ